VLGVEDDPVEARAGGDLGGDRRSEVEEHPEHQLAVDDPLAQVGGGSAGH
jgi:hypothetical protein